MPSHLHIGDRVVVTLPRGATTGAITQCVHQSENSWLYTVRCDDTSEEVSGVPKSLMTPLPFVAEEQSTPSPDRAARTPPLGFSPLAQAAQLLAAEELDGAEGEGEGSVADAAAQPSLQPAPPLRPSPSRPASGGRSARIIKQQQEQQQEEATNGGDEFAGLGNEETRKLAKERARRVKAEISNWCAAFKEREGRFPLEGDRLPIRDQVEAYERYQATYQAARNASEASHHAQESGGAEALEAGRTVEARYKGRLRWFPAVIEAVHPNEEGVDYSYDLVYDDGDKEAMVPRIRVRSPGEKEPRFIEPGAACEARFRGGTNIFPGVVVGTDLNEGDGTYHVRYADGDEERQVPRSLIFFLGPCWRCVVEYRFNGMIDPSADTPCPCGGCTGSSL
jgi:hypothetical protein